MAADDVFVLDLLHLCTQPLVGGKHGRRHNVLGSDQTR
jgi:hypothetical protein